jgi:putative salt-induced outer membrane protein YdiY
MFRFILTVILVVGAIQAQGQVINTETKRSDKKEDGWTGNLDLGLNYTKNTNEIWQLISRADIHYNREKHTVLMLSDLQLMSVNRDNIQNRGYQHFRYNYQIRPYLIPEAFVQAQYNQLWLIDLRLLMGAGPRFRLVHSDSTQLYAGALVMYEYENISNGIEKNRDVRLSAYVSGNFDFNANFGLSHITYFQPKIDDWADFRISSETDFRFSITSRLAFKTGLSLNYDSRPPEGLIKTFIGWKNTLSFNF